MEAYQLLFGDSSTEFSNAVICVFDAVKFLCFLKKLHYPLSCVCHLSFTHDIVPVILYRIVLQFCFLAGAFENNERQ